MRRSFARKLVESEIATFAVQPRALIQSIHNLDDQSNNCHPKLKGWSFNAKEQFLNISVLKNCYLQNDELLGQPERRSSGQAEWLKPKL